MIFSFPAIALRKIKFSLTFKKMESMKNKIFRCAAQQTRMTAFFLMIGLIGCQSQFETVQIEATETAVTALPHEHDATTCGPDASLTQHQTESPRLIQTITTRAAFLVDSTHKVSESISASTEQKRLGIQFPFTDLIPVGFYLPQGQSVQLRVTKLAGTRVPKLVIGTPSRNYTVADPYGSKLGTVPLLEGLNTVVNPEGVGGMLYLQYTDAVPSSESRVKFLSGMKPAPFYVLGKTTHDQWLTMLATLNDVPEAQLVSNRMIVTSALATAILYQGEDQNMVLNELDRVIAIESAFSGLDNSAPQHAPITKRLFATEHQNPEYYLYAFHGRTAYKTSAMNALLTVNTLRQNGWGVWHEVGHVVQQMWRWDAVREVTNNMQSLEMERENGISSRLSRENQWAKMETYFALPNETRNFNVTTPNVFVRLCMFQQLTLAFGEGFVHAQHKAYRVEKPVLADDAAKMRWFMLNSCKTSGRNLTAFFKKWGMPVPQSVYDEIQALNLPQPTLDITTLRDL
jgi:hypothetical protein